MPVTPVCWSPHALDALADRRIDRIEAEQAVSSPEFLVPDSLNARRRVCMRRYFDAPLGRDMLIRAVVEDTGIERVVVTVYKTSQLRKYLKGLAP